MADKNVFKVWEHIKAVFDQSVFDIGEIQVVHGQDGFGVNLQLFVSHQDLSLATKQLQAIAHDPALEMSLIEDEGTRKAREAINNLGNDETPWAVPSTSLLDSMDMENTSDNLEELHVNLEPAAISPQTVKVIPKEYKPKSHVKTEEKPVTVERRIGPQAMDAATIQSIWGLVETEE